jgi:hypothetical protein
MVLALPLICLPAWPRNLAARCDPADRTGIMHS